MDKIIKSKLLSEVTEKDFDGDEKLYYNVALSFYQLMLSNITNLGGKTNVLEKTTTKAIDTIRLMMTKDGFDVGDFRKIYMYFRDTVFWHKNIMSFSKLRKQANTLLISYNSQNIKKKPIDEVVSSVQKFNRNFD